MSATLTLIRTGLPWRARFLVALVGRDLAGRYNGAIFGWLWPIFVQIAQLLVFTYLFGAVFRVKMHVSGVANDTLAYGLWLFTGLVAWNAFSVGVLNAAPAIVAQPSLVKRVVFPLALLPIVPVLSAAVESIAGLAVVIVLAAVAAHALHPTILLLPVVLAVQIVLTAGIAFFVAGMTAFIRDIPQALGPLFLLFFYLTPIVYPASAVPPAVAGLVMFNPVAVLVEANRSLILSGTLPFGRAFAVTAVASALIFLAGWRFFRRVRPTFGDVV